jgi:hypothetical protein
MVCRMVCGSWDSIIELRSDFGLKFYSAKDWIRRRFKSLGALEGRELDPLLAERAPCGKGRFVLGLLASLANPFFLVTEVYKL